MPESRKGHRVDKGVRDGVRGSLFLQVLLKLGLFGKDRELA